jgi:hypothetical protein
MSRTCIAAPEAPLLRAFPTPPTLPGEGREPTRADAAGRAAHDHNPPVGARFPSPASRKTFSSYSADWLEARARHVRPGTVDTYRAVLGHAVRAFGPTPIGEVTRVDVERLVAGLDAAGKSKRTSALTLFVVRAILGQALDDGVVVRNVATKVEAPGVEAKPRHAFQRGRRRDPAAVHRGRPAARVLAAVARGPQAQRDLGPPLDRPRRRVRRPGHRAVRDARRVRPPGGAGRDQDTARRPHAAAAARRPRRASASYGRRRRPATDSPRRATGGSASTSSGSRCGRSGTRPCGRGCARRPASLRSRCTPPGTRASRSCARWASATTSSRPGTGTTSRRCESVYSHPDAVALASAGRTLSDVLGGNG